MRRTLWIFSAPVVAGGLAWAVNAADNQGLLQPRTAQTQPGKIFYFSRGGKTTTPPADATEDGTQPDADDSDAADQPSAPQRYVRNKAADSTAASPPVKNFYQDLFSETGTPAKDKSAPPASARRSAKPAAIKTDKVAANEECGVADSTHEDVPLPPASGKVKLASGTDDDGAVRRADYKSRDASTKRKVQQISGQAATSKERQALIAESDSAPSTDDEADTAAAPAPTPKPTKPAKAGATKTTRTNSANKSAESTVATKSRAAAKPAPRTSAIQTASADDSRDATTSAVQQAVATSGDAADVPLVSLRWTKNEEVNVGQECKCGLIVKNTGRLAAKDIVVEAYFPRSVRLVDAEPFPNDTKDHLIWIFANLDPGQEKTVQITLIPAKRGDLETSATVRFTGVASGLLKVEEPQLSLSIAGPREAMVGESLTQVITVSNPGTGIVHDVVVHAKVPAGLEHPRGKVVEIGVGSLGPGESRELRVPLAAVGGGDSVLLVEARGSSNLVQRAQAAIKIAAPKLAVEVAGPGLRYVGRNAQYLISVANDGVAATDNVRIVHLVPEGFEFVKADKGGKLETSTGSVNWFIGRVEAGQSMQVAVELKAKQIGEFLHHVQAFGENGTMAAAKTTTKVDGSASISFEVADLDDPVEVGTQTGYEICIRNDGSKAAQNLKITCDLPKGAELIDTKGPTEHFVEKGALHFKPVAELAAGSKITYLIRVNGKVAGNLRLRAKLTSNASTDPLVVEEMTKFYAD